MRRVGALLLLLSVVGVTGACEDSIHAGWLVDRPRVLGARVSAIADPRRASLAPGEPGRIEWLVAVPDGPPKLAWTFAVCVAPEGRFARSRCDAPVIATGAGATTSELVTTELTAPTTEALAGSTELVVLAAFCLEGTPTLDARAFTATCGAGAPAASADVRLATTEPNTNPPPPAVRLGDAALIADDHGTAGAPCASSPSAPKVAPAVEIDFVHVFDGAAREAQESLTLSTIVTGGELDRQYSAFDRDEGAAKETRVAWAAPGGDAVPAAGRVIRLYALIRDDRGGASFSRFSVCVSPN